MEKKTSTVPVKVQLIKAKSTVPLCKAETTTAISSKEADSVGDWIYPEYNMLGLKTLVKNSTILPQCIRAYKNNIAGFGIDIRYKNDIEETEASAIEFEKAEKIIELLNTENDTKRVFENLIEAREIYGIAYIEVIRNLAGEVQQIEFVEETPSITKTKPLNPYIETCFFYNGEDIPRKRKYCKYRQQINGNTVYFKEFGDLRIMDNRSGRYLEEGETLDIQYHANEILEYKIGTEPYGEVRWIGQTLSVDGSRKAESLNNNYFENGRHTPLAILVNNGTLTQESYEKLQEYMNDIKGEAGQHAFLLIETESITGNTDFETSEKPDIEIKDLASVLQKDELFQDYLDNNRRKVQSAFQLPDLYVGYTTDFNRATAQTVQEVTEEQVFQPERRSLAWLINNKLLNGYKFKYVEAYFREPKISNPDDLYRIMSVANSAGGLTPNKAKEIVFNALGETSEPYPDEWGEIPLSYLRNKGAAEDEYSAVMHNLQKQIEKAVSNNEDNIVSVMKQVKRLLQEIIQKEHSDG